MPTSSPVPGLPTCFAAYSRFPGKIGHHRGGGGREPWNPVEESDDASRRHRLFQVFQHALPPIPGFPAEMGAIGQEWDGNRGIRRGRVVALADVIAYSRFPTCLAACSRFPGRNGRHRAGMGREPWNSMGQSGGACRRHRLFQVFQHASPPIPGFPAKLGTIGQEWDGNRGIRQRRVAELPDATGNARREPWNPMGESGGAPLRH